MRYGKAACFAALALLAAPGVEAQESGVAAAFADADQNGDGALNVDEYVAHFVSLFGGVDADRDGRVSQADVPQVDPARFGAADANGDGYVSLGEAVAERMGLFFDIDSNRDGALSVEEIMVFERERN
ncbi:hypothetical protein [Rubrimonas cliftonensis]|uniref:EF hand n=1 Tax=Rubrimonas cliftonensis TaxID=89524 RepID=A0A1H3X107_9RHOB|nr:hypothetical protein [Rubrimonas cliftonensis]SDZ93076.1 EF hand [Rubrimonas cliftonensis]